MAPFPVTLFVLDNEEVEETYARTASRTNLMTLPILVSCPPVLTRRGLLGRSWCPLWESRSPRLALRGLSAYGWGLAAAPDASDRGGYVMRLLTQPHLLTSPPVCPERSRQVRFRSSGKAEKARNGPISGTKCG